MRYGVEHARGRGHTAKAGGGDPGIPLETVAGNEPPRLKRYLFSWREILAELGVPNIREWRNRVRRANKQFEGPISLPPKGGQPFVERNGLIEWWNELKEKHEKQLQESERQRKQEQANLEARYQYGRDAVVFPGISGSEKRRRKDGKAWRS